MRTCPDCQTQVEDKAVYCDNCGFRLQPLVSAPAPAPASTPAPQEALRPTSSPAGVAPGTCSACGYTNTPGEMFCQNCGVQLAPVLSSPPPPPVPLQAPVSGVPTPARPASACQTCGQINPPGERYCQVCGMELGVPPPPSAAPPAPPTPKLAPTQPNLQFPPPAAPRHSPSTGPIPCPTCGFSNPPDEGFCQNCGSQLFSSKSPAPLPATPFQAPAAPPAAPPAAASAPPPVIHAAEAVAPAGRCPSCGYTNPPMMLFCENCGLELVDRPDSPAPLAVGPAPLPHSPAQATPAPVQPAAPFEPPPAPTPPVPAPAPAQAVAQSPNLPSHKPVFCPDCGHPNQASFKFCVECGFPLGKKPPAEVEPAAPAPNATPSALAAPPVLEPAPPAEAEFVPLSRQPTLVDAPVPASVMEPPSQQNPPAEVGEPRTAEVEDTQSASLPTAVDAPPRAAALPAAAGSAAALRQCPSCGYTNPAEEQFCQSCGLQLTAGPGTPEPPSIPSPAPGSAEAVQEPAIRRAPSTAPFPAAIPPEIPNVVKGRLVVHGTDTSLPFPPGKVEVILGRTDPISGIFPDIDLTDHGGESGGVSRQHARLVAQGNLLYVEDLNSTNGTFLNKQKLLPEQRLEVKHGDELRLGRVVLVYSVD